MLLDGVPERVDGRGPQCDSVTGGRGGWGEAIRSQVQAVPPCTTGWSELRCPLPHPHPHTPHPQARSKTDSMAKQSATRAARKRCDNLPGGGCVGRADAYSASFAAWRTASCRARRSSTSACTTTRPRSSLMPRANNFTKSRYDSKRRICGVVTGVGQRMVGKREGGRQVTNQPKQREGMSFD